jgi:hypothetical protein
MTTKTKILNGYKVNGIRITKRRSGWIVSKRDLNPNYTPAGNPWVFYRTLTEAIAAVKAAA